MSDHISQLIDQTKALPHGENYLNAMVERGISLEAMPAEFIEAYPNNPMMLYLGGAHPVIYAKPEAISEELIHEITHTKHYCGPMQDLRFPADLKHAYIFYTAAEADAYAQQAKAVLDKFRQLGYDISTDQIEAIASKQNPDALWEPVRYVLYTVLNLQPEKLAAVELTEEQTHEIMFHVFSWTFQNFIPAQYEERHLDGVYMLTQCQDEHPLTQRTAPITDMTEEDLQYFLEAMQRFGALDHESGNYLINAEGYGPSPDEFLDPIFTNNVTREIERMNAYLDKPAFIQKLIAKVQALPYGHDLLALAHTHNYSIEKMPAPDISQFDEHDLAALDHNDGRTILYLTEDCDADDLVHELCHIHHCQQMESDITKPEDMKHRYISKAMREADAYARQAQAIILSLSDRATLQTEMNVYADIRNMADNPDDPDAQFISDACRTLLYRDQSLSPEELAASYSTPEQIAELMRDVFCHILYDYIPAAYEELHLDQINAEMNEMEALNDHYDHRTVPLEVHTEEDIKYFIQCLQAYGDWGRDGSYLIDAQGAAPTPDIFLDALFNPYVCDIIQEMNDHLLVRNDEAPAPETNPDTPELF